MKRNPTYFNHPNQCIDFSYIKGVSLAEAIYAPNLELPKHLHHNAGFCLTLRGSYIESEGNRVLECQPSDVKFNPAGDEHSNRYGSENVRVFVIELKKEWLARTGARNFVGNSPGVFRNNSIAWLMMKLRKEFHSRDLEASLAIEGIMLEIIAETSRNWAKFAEDKCPRWLSQAKEFIDDCFYEPLTLSIIAETVGVHPVYLANTFKRHYQCSIGEYLRRRRIEFASQKLSTSKDELVDIALASGFSNQSHFSRIFKQVTGLTPLRYRRIRQQS